MRTQQLQNAEKYQQTGAKGSGRIPSLVTQPADVKTISDLFSYVKQKDRHFNPKPSSKVVNPDGTPMVVYHGTGSDFNTFDKSRQGENYVQGEGGFFFTSSRRSAENYAKLAGEKKESIARMANANALTGTPETTAGTAPNTNISITNKNVNRPRLWATAKRSKKSPPCFL